MIPLHGTTVDSIPGDPTGVRGGADSVEAVGTHLTDVVSALQQRADALAQGWNGASAVVTPPALDGLGALVGTASDAMTTGAGALRTYADALETVQTAVTTARNDIDRIQQDYAVQASAAISRNEDAIAANEPVVAYGPGSPLGIAGDSQAQVDAAQRTLSDARDAFDAAALACRTALEGTRSSLVRGHRESFEDYIQGIVAEGLGHIPGMEGHEETLEAAVWATMAAAGVTTAAVRGSKAGIDLLQFWSATRAAANGTSAAGAAAPAIQGVRTVSSLQTRVLNSAARVLGISPASVQTFLAGQNAAGRLLIGSIGNTGSMWNAGRTAALASTGSRASQLATGVSAATRAGGLLRGLGVVGGVASTGMSLANVISQGNPIDAFQENGAAYVADVAEVGFNASLTALMIAPNPITAGATVITGAVYLGAELWSHREEIGALVSDGLDMAGDAIDATTEFVGDVVDEGLDKVKEVGSWLNPFD